MIKTAVPVRWRLTPAERRILLVIGDLLIAYFALFVGLYFWARGDSWLSFSLEFLKTRPAFWFWLLPFVWMLTLIDLYDTRRSSHRNETLRGIAVAAAIGTILYSLVYMLSEPKSLPRIGVAVFIVTTSLLTMVWRQLYISVFTAPQFVRRVLVVGAGKAGTTLVKVIKSTWPPPFYLVGLIDDDPLKIGTHIDGFGVLGDNQQMLKIIAEQNISDLVLAISGEMNSNMFQAILEAEERTIEVTTMPRVYEEVLGRVPIFLLEADWIIRSFLDQAQTDAFYKGTKRIIDICGGLVGSLMLGILFPFISLAVVLDSGFPIFHVQNRLGKNGQVFRLFKFRTMCKDAEKDGTPQLTREKDNRITRVGWFLRKTHLDEWPQFINVLRGELSLVGPRSERPELVEQLQKKIPFYRARLLVKPGLTGWAQINQHYAASVEEMGVKLEYDLYYIKHRNLMIDSVILLRTIGTVVGFKGH
jgi:exopolysaccharide biosynthesis polyprenyl glycosylphosphotransferase